MLGKQIGWPYSTRPLVRGAHLPLVHERDVRARAAHVQADGVLEPAQPGDVATGDRARGDPRRRDPPGEAADELARHDAAAGVQDQQVALVPAVLQALLEALDVPGHQRGEHRIGHGRGEALELEDLRQRLARRGHEHARQLLLEDLAHPDLVHRVRVGVHEADRDRLHLAPLEPCGERPRLVLVQRRRHAADVVDALGHLEPVPTPDVRGRDVLVRVPQVVLGPATDLQHVAEVARGHHRGGLEPPGDERVGRDRGAVREQRDVGELHASRLDAGHHPLHRVRRRARDLRDVDASAVLVEDEHVGEGPADIDGYAKSWHARHRTHLRRDRPTTTTSRPGGGSCTEETGGVLLSRALSGQVPSALRGLTALFGMGRGVSLSLRPPEIAESSQAAPQNCTVSHHWKSQSYPSSPRPISTGLLHTLLCFQIRPINLVVYQGSYSLKGDGRAHLEAGFPLRCLQRLSDPRVAKLRCPWQDNSYTRGAFIPVLSY